jgi:hypothetical protein
MVSDEMGRQAAALEGSAGADSCTGSGAREAEAAAVAYGMLSEFASEFGELLAGLAAVPERRAHMLAYLRANTMHACQRLLTSSSAAPGQASALGTNRRGAGQAQASDGGALTKGGRQRRPSRSLRLLQLV